VRLEQENILSVWTYWPRIGLNRWDSLILTSARSAPPQPRRAPETTIFGRAKEIDLLVPDGGESSQLTPGHRGAWAPSNPRLRDRPSSRPTTDVCSRPTLRRGRGSSAPDPPAWRREAPPPLDRGRATRTMSYGVDEYETPALARMGGEARRHSADDAQLVVSHHDGGRRDHEQV
jgi:hypothetical protein